MYIEKMKKSSHILSQIFLQLRDFIKPNISTEDIDEFCAKKIQEFNCISGALGYHGFPKNVCVSKNNVICHGISSKEDILKEGDIVSVDIALKHEDYYGDSCFTFNVGHISLKKELLIKATYETMWQAIKIIKPGITTGDLGFKMQSTAKKYGYNVIREFCGHGIGKQMHQDPYIPFYGYPNTGTTLEEGMCITIEPMVVEKSSKMRILEDNWTAITCDGGMAAQFEHTIHITNNGYEVLSYNFYDELNAQKKK
jgi:methionyl aminopeptidase